MSSASLQLTKLAASPSAYREWTAATRRLLEPLAELMQPGRADLPIAGPASDHDAQADRLESFARPLLLAAHYLASEPGEASSEEMSFRQRIARWFREGLAIGTDPTNPAYWGPDASFHQHHVEMGLLTIALQIAPRDLWDPLSQTERDRVAAWLGSSRGVGIVNNNHLFMGVHLLEFLGRYGYGRRGDAAVIRAHLNQLETMHRSGGWFEDGINQAYDHYNAYAFHFYGLWWSILHGAKDPERAARWRGWASLFITDYEHFFAASGEHPAFGRSILYRFNAIAVFGLAALAGCPDLNFGRLRRLCSRNLSFFLSRPIYQEQGCLSFGWTDRFEELAEAYSCAGSPYWAAKGLAPLLLPPNHPFWNDPEQALPSEQGDHARAIPAAGLVIRSTDGATEIINAGSMVSNTQLRYGAWKWSKHAYRSGYDFTIATPANSNWSPDAALTVQLDDGRVFGRHATVVLELSEQHAGWQSNFGFKLGQANTAVESWVWWRGDWTLQLHHLEPRQPVTPTLGSYALPLQAAELDGLAQDERPLDGWGAVFAPDGRGSAIQALAGFEAGIAWDERLDDTSPRRHISAPYHATPLLRASRKTGPFMLAALTWAGRDRSGADPWILVSAEQGHWKFLHPKLGPWNVCHWALPSLP
jgi:hypothetical protein